MCGLTFCFYFEESCCFRRLLIRVDCTVRNIQGYVRCLRTWHRSITISVRVMKALRVDPRVACVNVDHMLGHAGPGPHKRVGVTPARYCTPIQVVDSQLHQLSNQAAVPALAR